MRQARLGIGVSFSRGVATDHAAAEIRELLAIFWWARIVWQDAALFGSKAERYGDIELFERFHLSIEPAFPTRPVAVGPTEARAQVLHA